MLLAIEVPCIVNGLVLARLDRHAAKGITS